MIMGIGIDIIEVSRIENAVSRNKKFLEKLFSKRELNYIASRNYNSSTIAGMFSAKESISKALGTGIRGFNWKDIEIIHDKLGKPIVELNGNAREIANDKHLENISLSISHDKKTAISIAIGEGINYKKIEEKENVCETKDILIKRDKDSHKGTYGRVGVIAGSKGMSGAPYLTSSAAIRTGSGLVYTMVPDSISTILEIKSVEAVVKSFKSNEEGFIKESIEDIVEQSNKLDVIALGPGMGINSEKIELVEEILKRVDLPTVVDADGINCLCDNKKLLKNRSKPTIITPHLGEFSRLIKKDIDEIQGNREKYSREFAKEYGVILVLKGHETIVCDGERLYVNNTGNPGMATAGSGDVLTGIIVSLLGQGIPSYDAAKLGVYLHGLSGDIVAEDKGEHGLIASDIVNAIPYAIKRIN